jgi:peptidyl-prolyl cis-trans isomerase C
VVESVVREEILAREALALGLDRDDPVVRRRLAQKMGFLVRDLAPPREPTDDEMRGFLEEHAERYRVPAQLDFTQVFFSPDRTRGPRRGGREGRSREARRRAGPRSGDSRRLDHARPGPPGCERAGRRPAVRRSVRGVPGEAAGRADGAVPSESAYGLHVVRVHEREDGGAPDLDAVRDAVRRDLLAKRREETERIFHEKLRSMYRVEIDEAALSAAVATPAGRGAVRRSVLAASWCSSPPGRAAADLSQPALLDLTETAPGRYEVVFKLPRLGTRVLALRPVLPPVFRALSEPTYEIVQGAQVARWTVEADPWSLGGQRVEIEGLGASISDTVVRFRFRDGTVVTRILLPESPSCEIPEPTAAGDATAAESRRLARAIRGAVLEGLRHAASSVPHLLLVLALALAVPGRAVLRPLTGFAAGHAVGILLGTGLGLTLRLAPSEALLGVAAAIAARAAWRGEGAGLTAVAAIGGAVHGVALASGATLGTGALLAATLGVDAVQLLVGLGLAGLVSLVPRASLLAWPTGVAGVLVALLAATATHVPARDPAAPLFATAAAAVTAGGGPSSVPLDRRGNRGDRRSSSPWSPSRRGSRPSCGSAPWPPGPRS